MILPDIMVGDCLESLRTLPDGFVNTCVTSPPYYGLRDYGRAGQIGLEETPAAYVSRLVAVFREVRRVLRDDGTLWLNLGDSYATAARIRSETAGSSDGAVRRADIPALRNAADGLKEKDLIGVPWRVAFALQADGWYLRSDIIWHKPNPMPESVTDRPTKAHEYIFLLSKSPRYYYDAAAIKEAAAYPRDGVRVATPKNAALGLKPTTAYGAESNDGMRNKRSVWTVTPKPYKGAHFAVYPPDLIEPCILAGAPEWGIVLDPFGGSGTTGGVAVKNNRLAILCELNPDYAALIPDRVRSIAGRV